MEKKNKEFYRASSSGKGSGIQMKLLGDDRLSWEIANQTPGTNMQNKSYQWKEKQFFILNTGELTKILLWYKNLDNSGEMEIKFPHLKSSAPKNISFIAGFYNNKKQITLKVFNQQENPKVKLHTFNFSIEEFEEIVLYLEENIRSRMRSNLFNSSIIDLKTNEEKPKSIGMPKMAVGEAIKFKENFSVIKNVAYDIYEQKIIYYV